MTPQSTSRDAPPPGSPMGRFARRLGGLLVRPAHFWEALQKEEVPTGELMAPHLVLLIGIRAVAGAIGTLLAGGGVVAAIISLLGSFVSWFALVWVFALVVGSFVATSGGHADPKAALRFAVYGVSPLFVVGVLAAIPVTYVTPIAELLAMPYAFWTLAVGVMPELKVPQDRAPALVGRLCGALLILWSVMPTLLPKVLAALTT